MLDSLNRSNQLGEHADRALIAVHKARIHCWDNSMKRYHEEFIDKLCDAKNRWVDKQNTENIARRFRSAMDERLKQPIEERMSAQEFYTRWHSNHQECSQFHLCRIGYCQRVRKVKSDDESPDTTHIVCRHMWPWCRKMCLCCAQSHSLVNSDICMSCIEKETPIPEKPECLPYDVIHPARVEHSTRFDKHGNFRMAPAHVVGPANNPSINTHNFNHTFTNNGNTDLKHPINPGAVRCYLIGYLCKAHCSLAEIEECVRRVFKALTFDPDMRNKPAAQAIQRIVSSAVAARTFSTQNAC